MDFKTLGQAAAAMICVLAMTAQIKPSRYPAPVPNLDREFHTISRQKCRALFDESADRQRIEGRLVRTRDARNLNLELVVLGSTVGRETVFVLAGSSSVMLSSSALGGSTSTFTLPRDKIGARILYGLKGSGGHIVSYGQICN
jgi:hypothetical protein